MHRMIEISVPPETTQQFKKDLMQNPHVIGFSLLKGVSQKPPGDVLQIHVLNRGSDDVLQLVETHCKGKSFTVVTSEVASITDSSSQKQIDKDIDEAIWEEMETGLRHNGRLTTNFLILMGLGGIITAIGFVGDVQMQVIAFIAASIIAPGLEPVAKLPLGMVLKQRDIIWEGCKATLAGYAVLMAAAAITFYILLTAGATTPDEFLKDELAIGLRDVTLKDFLSSVAAAAASIIMYLSFRRNVIAGPLIVLIVIPAAAGAAMCLILGEWSYAGLMMKRLGTDLLLIVVIGCLLMWLKQHFVHRRKPLR